MGELIIVPAVIYLQLPGKSPERNKTYEKHKNVRYLCDDCVPLFRYAGGVKGRISLCGSRVLLKYAEIRVNVSFPGRGKMLCEFHTVVSLNTFNGIGKRWMRCSRNRAEE